MVPFLALSFIFIVILLGIIEQSLGENNKNENISEVMLFIPKIQQDFEEKRDELQAKYEKLVDIADDEWDDAKESFKTRFARLKEKLKNALD